MPDEQRVYKSYLLRIWLSHSPEDVVWRASLEDARNGERLGFATLEQLFAFVLEQTRGRLDTFPMDSPGQNEE